MNLIQRPCTVQKSGGDHGNVVGKICPLVVKGLTELQNSGWACPPTSGITEVVSSELLPTAGKHREKQKQIETGVFTIYVGGLVIH